MTIALERKRPNETRDYTHVWTDYLDGDQISTQTTTSDDVTVDSSNIISGGQSIKFWLSGGTSGKTAVITQTIVTAGGRTETEIFTLPVLASEEPVSLQEIKDHLNIIDDDSNDNLLQSYVISARAFVESEGGIVLVQRQFTETFNAWPSYIQLARRPIISIDSIEYISLDGTTQPFTDFAESLGKARIFPSVSWPSLGANGSVQVKYTAGFTEREQAEEVDMARQAIMMLVAHWFANRESVNSTTIIPAEVPLSTRALIERFRMAWV